MHSVGRFGLWIFPGYTPTVSGSCNDMNPSPAKFDYLYSYNNDKGGEWVMSSSIQFRYFTIFDQNTCGIDTKTIVIHDQANSPYASSFNNEQIGPAVLDSIIIGNSQNNSKYSITPIGLSFAWDRGQLIKNVKFINFPDSGSVAFTATTHNGRCM